MSKDTVSKPEEIELRMVEDLWKMRDHKNHTCPACNEDVSRVALVNLVYKFDTCNCSVAGYPHLVVTVYHYRCIHPTTGENHDPRNI